MKRLAFAALATAALSSACSDSPLFKAPALRGPTALIMDAAHEGTDRDFFFLPPLAPNPVLDPHFDKGAFNGRLSPTLKICRLLTDLSACEATILGPLTVPAAPSEESYQFLWATRASNLTVGRTYRVIVMLGTRELGVLDVQPLDRGIKNVRTDDFYQFLDDRTVPIKFRIEFHGTSCPAGIDCGDGRITADGGLVTTNTGFAGALFPAGWLPAAALVAGITQVDVRIRRISVDNADPAASCLRSGLVEIEGCYRFETVPDLHQFGVFSQLVTAGVCLEDPELVRTDAPFQMHRREELDGTPTGETVALESAAADFLTCTGFTATEPPSEIGARSTGLLHYAGVAWHALVRSVAHVVQPPLLHAVDLGAGGKTGAFSRFGWARAATMVKVASTDNQTGTAGERLPDDPTVCLTLHHPTHPGQEGFPPLMDEPVTFTVTSGGGSVDESGSSTVVRTGENGCASVAWFLGSSTTPGGNTLTATAATRGSPQTFTATGTAGVTRLTTTAGFDGEPDWSPDGTKIAFQSERDGGDDEIYVMNADGTGVVRLTNNPGIDATPVWSPDGTKIAFRSTRGTADREIFVMNADGTGVVQRTTGGPLLDWQPAWSPDGTKIAFSSARSRDFEIYVMNADGTGILQLTTTAGADLNPVWSPDGAKIAFDSQRDEDDEIYVMNTDGTGAMRLTNSPGADFRPAWSPDGTKIAFDSQRDGGHFAVYAMNADGTGVVRLASSAGQDFSPAWSPDGTKIAFSSSRDDPDGDIYVMHVAGTGPAEVATHRTP